MNHQRNGLDEGKVNEAIRTNQFVWIDLIKAFALGGIILNHIVEQIYGYPYIANPDVNWPPFNVRLAQLAPLTGYGLGDIPVNLIRYAGWFGEHGVELFLITSGFGLTWGLLAKNGTGQFSLRDFIIRRIGRIYPQWWGAHLLFMGFWLLTGWGLSLTRIDTYLSFLGIRITSGLLYYFSPAWWYVGLLLQLYLVYPLLWKAMRRWGPIWLLIVSCVIAFLARAAGSLLFTDYLDAWLRGAIFITRLPEFVLGITLAFWMYRDLERLDKRLRAPSTLLFAIFCIAISFPLSLTLLGMAFVPFLLGFGLFILFYLVLSKIRNQARWDVTVGKWVGQHSYSLYLIHHSLILILIPVGLAAVKPWTIASILITLTLTVAGAIILEWTTERTSVILKKWHQKSNLVRMLLRVVIFGVAIYAVLIACELAVYQFAPQEVLGWGERPSLEPDPVLGWRLIPSQTTHLRWESYDYYLTSNSLGFPGPEYPDQKPPNTIRIMTVGDAFTSAEGVNTEQSWPRLLETDLQQVFPDEQIQVMNFAVTAYGPDQYAALVKEFAPIYKPDLVIIGLFVNDYQDVLLNKQEYIQSIGFGLPAQDGWFAHLRLEHLKQFIHLRVIEPLLEQIRNRPGQHGYFLGNFLFLEKGNSDIAIKGRQLVSERLKEIKNISDQVGSKVMIAMIPAPVQVCNPDQLAYYPRSIDISNTDLFDLDQPQRMTSELAGDLDIPYYDLRPVLKSVAGGCPYQQNNMHWTITGHKAAAEFLAQIIADEKVLMLSKEP
jgi:peptidoglycan/LPS O-acetylase OafA/YrhL